MLEKLNLLEQALSLDIQSLLAVFFIFALAGFVSGLSGFGFSAVGIAVLWFMHPTRAIPLLMALSTVHPGHANHLSAQHDFYAIR